MKTGLCQTLKWEGFWTDDLIKCWSLLHHIWWLQKYVYFETEHKMDSCDPVSHNKTQTPPVSLSATSAALLKYVHLSRLAPDISTLQAVFSRARSWAIEKLLHTVFLLWHWLLSLHIMLPRCVHVVVCDCSHPFSWLYNIPPCKDAAGYFSMLHSVNTHLFPVWRDYKQGCY